LIPLESFPALNASLNATTAVLLVIGWFLIRSGRREAHRWTMVSAFCVSSVFLACYLWYHAHHGVTHYEKTGVMRPLYFTILGTHTVLAVLVLPIILRTLYLAGNNRFAEHKIAARWAFPIWLYVSTTGVAVYWMLYRL
jgi:putative membrane protein